MTETKTDPCAQPDLRNEASLRAAAVELARLADDPELRARGIEGLELNETASAQLEYTATDEGVSGSQFALRQRFVRTAGSRVGYVCDEDASRPLAELVRDAVGLSGCADGSVPAGLVCPDSASGGDAPADVACCDGVPALPAPDAAAMRACAERLRGLVAAKAADPMAVECTVRHYAEGHAVANSRGLVRAASGGHYLARASFIARGETEMHDMTCRAYAPSLEGLDLERLAARTVALAEASLDGGQLPSGRYPVVLSSHVACQMLMGIWQIFSASKLAARQSFLHGKVGEQVASPALTIADGPACGGGFKPPFDVEGAPKGRTPVVDAGRFVEPLSDLAWAGRMGLSASSGNAARRDTLGRIVPNDVTVAPSCICIEPGTSSLSDLFAQMATACTHRHRRHLPRLRLRLGRRSAPSRGVWVPGEAGRRHPRLHALGQPRIDPGQRRGRFRRARVRGPRGPQRLLRRRARRARGRAQPGGDGGVAGRRRAARASIGRRDDAGGAGWSRCLSVFDRKLGLA